MLLMTSINLKIIYLHHPKQYYNMRNMALLQYLQDIHIYIYQWVLSSKEKTINMQELTRIERTLFSIPIDSLSLLLIV